MELSNEQQIALDELLEFCSGIGGEPRCHILTGSAGTGKTTVIQWLIERLEPHIRPVFTAPTNKAVKVLRRMAREKGITVECVTIHKLLGLRLVAKEGKQTLETGKDGINQLPPNTLIVVDEASMVNEELLDYILDSDADVIFMGDGFQLPPVGEKTSPALELEDATRSKLTTVMRQAAENPILALCTQVVDSIKEIEDSSESLLDKKPICPQGHNDNKRGVYLRPQQSFTTWMPSIFGHERFSGDTDLVRVIAWRNKTVDAYNAYIQQLRYPGLSQPFALGEPVVFSDPLQRISGREKISEAPSLALGETWDDILCSTETEGIVISITPQDPFVFESDFVMRSKGFNFLPITIETFRVEIKVEDGSTVFCTMTPDKANLGKILDTLSRACQARIVPWWRFWQLKGYFANVRPVYALTAHKAQGSTFKNVFVDVADILANTNKSEALRCLYVAISRASENAVLKLY